MTDLSKRPSGRAEEKIWLSSYPKSVAPEIPHLPHASLREFFEEGCRINAERIAFSSMGKDLTFQEMEEKSAHIGAWLQALGLEKGDRVAVMLPNILQNPVIVYGILRAGLIVVNVNPLYTPRELKHQLIDSGATAIFVLENFAYTVQQVVAETSVKHVVVATMGDMLGLKGLIVNLVVRHVKKLVPKWSIPGHISFNQALENGSKSSLNRVPIQADDVAFLQYTGGTTGVSKGAALTHGNLISNALQIKIWLEEVFTRRQRPEVLTFVCALPLYHIFALTVNSLMGVLLGAHNILIANPRDIPGFITELKQHKAHVFPGLNTLFNALMNNKAFDDIDFSSMLLVLGGGMAVQRPVADRWFEKTGCVITEGYGLSETSPVATVNRLDSKEFSGTIGLPLPSTDIEIRGEAGETLPIGEIGEICIRGPQVMAGYWQKPEETARVMSDDGFFRSGDMGLMDEHGYVTIVDRKKDMILVSGFNVYPNEIEEVVAMHPGVLECAAVGVPDEHSGEAVKLFVVKKDQAITEAEIKAHCAVHLTNYKRPRHIEFREELPKTNVGKILRKDLRG
ncbi:long-chain-fatty-acid--CoA ligase [Agrobacterium sp. ES01]|uniref:long-chain-fatty-acid--CoA ligase n=1 Tax=Agrobacterium sp. ES01 TaxID=3420714 RepID=UPI003D0DC6A9